MHSADMSGPKISTAQKILRVLMALLFFSALYLYPFPQANVFYPAIVLMHVAAKHTAEALPNIIKRLRAEGYELVTVSTLLGITQK